MMDLSEVRAEWELERPNYEMLAQEVRTILGHQTRSHGIVSTVDSRVKDTPSLLKKVLAKRYPNPLSDVTDKAGARVVVNYAGEVEAVGGIIEQTFLVREKIDKLQEMPTDRLGYLGTHYVVSLKPEKLKGELSALTGLVCEIQVNTRPQRLWADLSHELLYKPAQKPSGPAERMINRLMALVEIFDAEAARAKETIENQPGYYEASVVAKLETQFFKLTGKQFDRELSLEIVHQLFPLYGDIQAQKFGQVIDEFVASNLPKLEFIYAQYEGDDRCSPLLFQPESILIFERLSSDKYDLKDRWVQFNSEDLLDDLANIWGTAI